LRVGVTGVMTSFADAVNELSLGMRLSCNFQNVYTSRKRLLEYGGQQQIERRRFGKKIESNALIKNTGYPHDGHLRA